MDNGVNCFSIQRLIKLCSENQSLVDGEWTPNRPLGNVSLPFRFKCLWLVLTGRADLVVWF